MMNPKLTERQSHHRQTRSLNHEEQPLSLAYGDALVRFAFTVCSPTMHEETSSLCAEPAPSSVNTAASKRHKTH